MGRTRMTIIKVALADVEFFNNENHPAVARVDNLSIGMWVEFAGKTTTTLAVSWLQKSARSTNSFS